MVANAAAQPTRGITFADELPVTRIDFLQAGEGVVHVWKFRDGWLAGENCREEDFSINYKLSLPEMLAWCRSHGYTVYEWHNGARAFLKGTERAVRSKAAIVAMRNRLERQLYEYQGHHPLGEVGSMDLALYL